MGFDVLSRLTSSPLISYLIIYLVIYLILRTLSRSRLCGSWFVDRGLSFNYGTCMWTTSRYASSLYYSANKYRYFLRRLFKFGVICALLCACAGVCMLCYQLVAQVHTFSNITMTHTPHTLPLVAAGPDGSPSHPIQASPIMTTPTSTTTTTTPFSSTFTIALPGITIPLSFLPLLFLATLLSIVVHECCHSMAASVHNIHTHAFGVFVSPLFPGAYVDLPSLMQAAPLSRLYVAMAGVTGNVVLVLFAGAMYLCCSAWVYHDGVFVNQDIHTHSPLHSLAFHTITHVNQHKVTTDTLTHALSHTHDSATSLQGSFHAILRHVHSQSFTAPQSAKIQGSQSLVNNNNNNSDNNDSNSSSSRDENNNNIGAIPKTGRCVSAQQLRLQHTQHGCCDPSIQPTGDYCVWEYTQGQHPYALHTHTHTSSTVCVKSLRALFPVQASTCAVTNDCKHRAHVCAHVVVDVDAQSRGLQVLTVTAVSAFGEPNHVYFLGQPRELAVLSVSPSSPRKWVSVLCAIVAVPFVYILGGVLSLLSLVFSSLVPLSTAMFVTHPFLTYGAWLAAHVASLVHTLHSFWLCVVSVSLSLALLNAVPIYLSDGAVAADNLEVIAAYPDATMAQWHSVDAEDDIFKYKVAEQQSLINSRLQQTIFTANSSYVPIHKHDMAELKSKYLHMDKVKLACSVLLGVNVLMVVVNNILQSYYG